MSEKRAHITPVFLSIWLVTVTGCASHKQVLQPILSSQQMTQRVELTETPFFSQTKHYCGPASLATILNHSGIRVEPHHLAPWVYLPEKQGSLQIELMGATRHFERVPYQIMPNLTGLLSEINSSRPVLVLLNLGWRKSPVWHYAVVIGYEANPERIVLRSGTVERKLMSTASFLKAWNKANKWGFVALRPGELPAKGEVSRYLEAVAAMESAGDPDSALRSYSAAAKRWPASAMAQFGLGNVLYTQHRLAEAETAFRSAVDINSEMVVARNNLAHVLAERGCLVQALEEIDTAISFDPKAPDMRDVILKTRKEITQRLNSTAEPMSCTSITGHTFQ